MTAHIKGESPAKIHKKPYKPRTPSGAYRTTPGRFESRHGAKLDAIGAILFTGQGNFIRAGKKESCRINLQASNQRQTASGPSCIHCHRQQVRINKKPCFSRVYKPPKSPNRSPFLGTPKSPNDFYRAIKKQGIPLQTERLFCFCWKYKTGTYWQRSESLRPILSLPGGLLQN